METVVLNAQIWDSDGAVWHDTLLAVRPRLLTLVGPYGGHGLRFVPGAARCRCKDLKNWARAAFGRPVLCYESAVVVNEEEMTLTIDPGFPCDEPYVVRVLEAGVKMQRIKEIWCASSGTTKEVLA